MFKYKLNSYYDVNNFDSNYLTEYLKAIGIKDYTRFLSPQKDDELSPYLLTNMKQGVELMEKVLAEDLKVALVVD